ncbi:MAG TPA: GNAT family N-acetyltransferase [Steroidobacteraceae bacterium]|nr:GNAT family N-acetyltransferase [Steroidobacteraceae bacterium]
MNWQVVPTERRHIAGFRDVLDSVARERRYLAFLEAPSAAQMRRFVLNNLRNGNPQFVAVEDDRVLGWCDIAPKTHATLRHVGALGMGIAAPHRSRGIGKALLQATIEAAAARGISRIELLVRADNEHAIALYRRFGFELEGRLRDYLIVDGASHDVLAMARLEYRGDPS